MSIPTSTIPASICRIVFVLCSGSIFFQSVAMGLSAGALCFILSMYFSDCSSISLE